MHEIRTLIRRYVVGAWRHRWIAIAAAWALCTAGWIATTFIPNIYEADARLYVDADQVLTPLLKGLALDNTMSGQLEVLQRTLLSRPNLEKLVSKTDLELGVSGPADLERIVAELGRDIKLVSQTRNLFTITYRNAKPKLAYDVVQTILNIFIESKSGNNRSDMENARLFLQQQVSSYEQQLREAERKRAEFKTQYIDLLPSDASGTTKLEEARNSVRLLTGQLVDAKSRRSLLATELAGTQPMITLETDAGTSGGGALAAARRKLKEMQATMTDANPEVTRQKDEIVALQNGGGDEGGRAAVSHSIPNSIYDQLKVRLLEADADIASLQRQVQDATRERDRLEGIARNVPELQAQFLNLDRDYDVLRKNYDELIARREEMRIASAADSSAEKVKLQIVDPPQVPQTPAAPNRAMLVTGVLLGGLAGGIGVTVMLSQLDHSFYTLKDLRSFGLPVVGGVSLLTTRTARARRSAARAAALAAAAVLLLCCVYGGLLLRAIHSTGSV